MMYLIIEETQYSHTDNTYHIEDCTNDYNFYYIEFIDASPNATTFFGKFLNMSLIEAREKLAKLSPEKRLEWAFEKFDHNRIKLLSIAFNHLILLSVSKINSILISDKVHLSNSISPSS